MPFIKRSVLGFVVGGLAFTQIQLQFLRVDAKQWILLALASALLGFVSAWVLQSLNDEGRRLKSWSSGGWAVAALAFLGAGQAIAGSFDSSLVFVIPTALAGFCGGAGFGVGWRGVRAALVLGCGSAVALPLAVWVNVRVYSELVPVLFREMPDLVMSEQGMTVLMWAAVATAFALYGAVFGIVLAAYEAKRPGRLVIHSTEPSWAQHFRDAEAEPESIETHEVAEPEEAPLP